MRYLLLCAVLLTSVATRAQHTLSILVKDDQTKQSIAGVTAYINELKRGAAADSSGHIQFNLPTGKYEIKFSMVGYLPQEKTFVLPLKNIEPVIEVYLEPMAGELAEVVVQTNRTNQNRSDVPTRIEALPAEELDEKSTMRPGDIKMLLGEITGVHVQATSAVSGTASFRIQGLDSRYTQLLQDGLPMYDGFSGGLSLVQVSPLNLKQAEIIKGSASTLYGGGAIGGLVNLITKTPAAKPELTLLLNQNSAKGTDASGFYSQQWTLIGTTIFSSYNYNGAYDPGNTGLSAVPKTNRFTLAPKVFLKPGNRDQLWFGVNFMHEDRLGGDMQVINGHADNQHQYFERNLSDRLSTQFSYTHKLDSNNQLNFKSTVGYFYRTIAEPQFLFKGDQLSSYTEANYVRNGKIASWVAGADVWTDHLPQRDRSVDLSYSHNTYGIFAQNTFKPTKWLAVESGIRLDENSPSSASSNGLFLLPRVNTLFTLGKHWSSRVGGGLGYKMPDIFNDDAEEQGYRYLQPLNIGATKAERSAGANADVNYKGAVGDAFLQVNHLFFLTKVNDPLILQNNAFINAPGYLISKGAETNVKLLMDELGIYLGYTYTNVQRHFNGLSSAQALTPKHQLNADLTYEVENSFRAGVEGFYTGSQLLDGGTTGRDYWTFGLLVQKMWKHFVIFINAENLTDQRQNKWGTIYAGSISNPVFKNIYAPLDGRVINAGVIIKLLNNK
ncbi:TonB-dependent receptor [Mucilaginibacter sp. P25]|uniref:Iron complex outermembrane recepter protein n=1 Tax=Mucilaginibacter gossypii TaxID=551996 RepID=A0A1G7U8M1_9SPHI|nr:TonB-dependent receptor [Mucilaginibacter gossypii]SDG43661.1 iron complex outermembrane recepter protein [Mucilaginibacter gossypii]